MGWSQKSVQSAEISLIIYPIHKSQIHPKYYTAQEDANAIYMHLKRREGGCPGPLTGEPKNNLGGTGQGQVWIAVKH